MSVKGLTILPGAKLGPASSVAEACTVMDREKLGAIAVIDDAKVVGIFTYRDLVARVVLEKRDPTTTPLSDVMTDDVQSIGFDGSYGDALRLMVESDFTYLPIVGADGTFAGLLSLRVLLDHHIDCLADDLDSMSQYVAVDGPGGD